MYRRRSIAFIILQILSAVVALPAMALWPPATGVMMIVPLDGTDANQVFARAIAGHARVVGTGFLRGSLVVVGDRATIVRQFAPWSVLTLAPTAAGCGLPLGREATA